MSKDKALTHQEIERLIADYMQAYRMTYGPAMADKRTLIYRKGWFYFCEKELDAANPNSIVGVPYRAKEIEEQTAMFRKGITPRLDTEEDSFE